MKIAPPGAGRGCRWIAALLAGCAVLTGCATTGTPKSAMAADSTATSSPAQASPDTATTLYVVRRGWHIDVGVEAGSLAGPLRSLRGDFPSARYVLFGFGDRRYLESHRRALPNLLTALWPGDGLLLVTALSDTPQQAFGPQWVVQLRLSAAQVQRALAAVTASLALQGGAVQVEDTGPYVGSEYLRALARYSAVHTCNTWAAEMLQAAGEPVRSRRVLFAGQLWRQVARLPRN